MRISTKGRHAVMVMVDLARNGEGKPISLAEVASRQEISLSYLEQLVARLKSHGLVRSLRGPGGGYMLAVPSEKITVLQIVSAVDDPTARITVNDPATASGRQLTDLLWQTIGDEISDFLETITLADVSNCSIISKSNNAERHVA